MAYIINECASAKDRVEALQSATNAMNITELGDAVVDGNLVEQLVDTLVAKDIILNTLIDKMYGCKCFHFYKQSNHSKNFDNYARNSLKSKSTIGVRIYQRFNKLKLVVCHNIKNEGEVLKNIVLVCLQRVEQYTLSLHDALPI